MPAVDEADLDFIVAILAEVSVGGGEEADPFVGFARLVAGRGPHLADRVVECLESTAGGGQFEGQFDVVAEGLALLD